MRKKDREARLANESRLRALKKAHGSQVHVFCGHDPVEFEQLAGRSLSAPIDLSPTHNTWPLACTSRSSPGGKAFVPLERWDQGASAPWIDFDKPGGSEI